jgi:mono/diheme cytochrome c family protein
MDFQEKGEAQERNDFFADHRFMRTPPPGTVAVGHLQEDDHRYRGIGLDGTVVDALPEGIELDETLLERGRARFNIYCAPCHGETGNADGPAARRGGGMAVDPANLHMQKLQPAPLGYFFRVMTYGKGQMRPYNVQVKPEDRWAIAAWVRVLQVSHRAKASDIPADADNDKTARRAP